MPSGADIEPADIRVWFNDHALKRSREMDRKGRHLSDLIDGIYSAAIDADRWPTVLEQLAGAFGGLQATLYSHHTRGRSANIHAHWGVNEDFLTSYTEHFAGLNPFVNAVSRLSIGASATAGDMIDVDLYTRSEFFNDWVRPQGCGEFITTKLHSDASSVSGITVLRGERSFSASERTLWLGLGSHLRRAMQLHREFCNVRLARDGAVEALNGLSVGVVMAGTGGMVLFANAAAERALETGSGIRSIGGRLCGETAGASEALSRTVDAAVATSGGRGSDAGSVLAMPTRVGDPIPVLVSPLPGGRGSFHNTDGAALVIIGGGRRVRVASTELMRAFGLTPAEARLLVALVEGESLSTYAKDNAIALETVRAHLRKVLDKTGATRQAGAIRRVLSDLVLTRLSGAAVPGEIEYQARS